MKNTFNLLASILLVSLLSISASADLASDTAAAVSYDSSKSRAPLFALDTYLQKSKAGSPERIKGETALIRLLAPDATYEAKRFACTLLAVYGSENAVPPLAKLLDSKETAGIACMALEMLPSAKAGEALLAALKRTAGSDRVPMIAALGNRGEAASAAMIAELAGDADATVARSAILALGRIGGTSVRKTVEELLKQPNPVCIAELSETALKLAEQAVAEGDNKTALKLCSTLLSTNFPPYVRRGAFTLMMSDDKDGGLARIRSQLTDAKSDAALTAVAIARVAVLQGGKKVSATFSDMLPALTSANQVLILQALALRKDSVAQATIRKQVGSKDTLIREVAITAIGRNGNEEDVALLASALTSASTPHEEKTIGTAFALLKGDDKTDKAICNLVRKASDVEKVPLINVLGYRGSAVTTDLLLSLSKSDDKSVRTAVGKAFLRIAANGDSSSYGALKEALSHQDAQVRKTALLALAAWSGGRSWSVLLTFYKETDYEDQLGLAFRGMLRILNAANAKPDDILFNRYSTLLGLAKKESERKSLVNMLAGVAHPKTLQLLHPLLQDAAVKSESATAVKRVAGAIQKKHPKEAQQALQWIGEADEVADETGFVPMFNGKDLSGWDGKSTFWKVVDGLLVGETTAENPCKKSTYMLWKGGTPGDFEIRTDFRLSKDANSGIHFHAATVPEPISGAYRFDAKQAGCQADMSGDGKLIGFFWHPVLFLTARGAKVTLADNKKTEEKRFADSKAIQDLYKAGEWNNYRLVCRGTEYKLYLNGIKAAHFIDNRPNAPRKGVIMLQVHQGKPMKVEYRNLRIKML